MLQDCPSKVRTHGNLHPNHYDTEVVGFEDPWGGVVESRTTDNPSRSRRNTAGVRQLLGGRGEPYGLHRTLGPKIIDL